MYSVNHSLLILCDRQSPAVNRGLIGLIADGSAVTCGQPCLNRGLIGLIVDGLQIQLAATAGDLRSPDEDNKIWALSHGGGRLISNVFDICYDHKGHPAATYRVSENWLAQPQKYAQIWWS